MILVIYYIGYVFLTLCLFKKCMLSFINLAYKSISAVLLCVLLTKLFAHKKSKTVIGCGLLVFKGVSFVVIEND